MYSGNRKSKQAVIMGFCFLLILLAVVACGNGGTGSAIPTAPATTTTSSIGTPPTIGATSTPQSAPSVATAPFKVIGVDMSVNPASIAGMSCGSNLTVAYTATFHAAPGSAGGTVQFGYTVNNGRGESMASVNFAAGETTKTYTFTWSGALPIDHTYPEPGGVIVSSPNAVNSPLLGPSGSCS